MTEVQEIMRKAAEYVAATQPELEKQAAANTAFVKRAQRTVGVLVHRNIIEADKQDRLIDKLAQDHTCALDLLEKLAGIIGADQIGAPSTIMTKTSEGSEDPWIREYFPEQARTTGML